MKVMGHRGAAGLALENTIDSFELAKILGVDFIELDIHITKDERLVVVHDNNLSRVGNDSRSIKNMSYSDIRDIKLIDNKSNVPLLEDVISLTKEIPLIIEIKSSGCIDKLLKVIKDNPRRDIVVASFKHNELKKIRKKDPKIQIFALENTKPIEIIQFATSQKLNGIGLNYWLLNPLTYFLAKRHKLSIYVYTVNNKIIGSIIRLLYPNVIICSDYPERFMPKKMPQK
jgi:glycerophosphoryl diester phosphodiesterase